MPRTSLPTQHKLNDISVDFLSHFAYLDFFCLVGILLVYFVFSFCGVWEVFLSFCLFACFCFLKQERSENCMGREVRKIWEDMREEKT